MSLILTVRRLRQDCDIKVSLNYILRLCIKKMRNSMQPKNIEEKSIIELCQAVN
jgi:hypothetical protein